MESREKLSDSIVQFRNQNENPEAIKIEKTEKTVVQKPRFWLGRAYRVTRIIRAVEFFILVALLALTIYLMSEISRKLLTNVAEVLLIALFSTYLLILSVDMISRIIRRNLPDTPMFVFGVLGFLLFAVAAEGVYILLFYPNLDAPLLLAIMILCVIEAVLFFLDVTLLIINWRQSYTRVDKCPFGTPVSNIATIYRPMDKYSQRTVRISDPSIFEGNVRDVTTSISDYQRPSHPDLANLHKYRKIGVGHRPQYIDRPVKAPSATYLRVVEVQTEPPQQKKVSDVESLIVADVKEEPAQTTPKCPVCTSNWDPQGAFFRSDNFGLCPTFLQIAQALRMCNCNPPSSSVLRPFPVGLRAESTSVTEIEGSKKVEKPNSRINSSDER